MPAPTEEQVLTHVLESLDDNSKITKNIKIQKWFLLCVVLAAFAVVFIGYKYACIKTLWLLFAAGICGMALMGLVYMQQVQFQTALLKPYINVSLDVQVFILAFKNSTLKIMKFSFLKLFYEFSNSKNHNALIYNKLKFLLFNLKSTTYKNLNIEFQQSKSASMQLKKQGIRFCNRTLNLTNKSRRPMRTHLKSMWQLTARPIGYAGHNGRDRHPVQL